MNLIDNVRLSSSSEDASGHSSWLEDILLAVRNLSRSEFVIRLTCERRGTDLVYRLQNSVNKTYADLRKVGSQIRLSLYQRELPDPEKGFKPGLSTPQESAYVFNYANVHILASLIQAHLDKDTAYSLGQITRIKVTPTASPLEPWTFAGGSITAIKTDPTGQTFVINEGAQEYFIANERLEGHRPNLKKFILLNEDGDFQFVTSTEFEFYFEMKNVH